MWAERQAGVGRGVQQPARVGRKRGEPFLGRVFGPGPLPGEATHQIVQDVAVASNLEQVVAHKRLQQATGGRHGEAGQGRGRGRVDVRTVGQAQQPQHPLRGRRKRTV
jgi:hypothetical protein